MPQNMAVWRGPRRQANGRWAPASAMFRRLPKGAAAAE